MVYRHFQTSFPISKRLKFVEVIFIQLKMSLMTEKNAILKSVLLVDDDQATNY
jgi:hypothetical protein